MHADEREDVAQFAFEVVKAMADSQGGPDGTGRRKPDPGFVKVLETVGIEPADFLKSLIEIGAAGVTAELPPGQVHSFRDLMMPALVRVGAVTERTREPSTTRRGIPSGRTPRCSSASRTRTPGTSTCPGWAAAGPTERVTRGRGGARIRPGPARRPWIRWPRPRGSA